MIDPLSLGAEVQYLKVAIVSSNVTLKNAMRRRILDAARVRGGATGNLWYAWSEKNHASLLLPSDIALIYWLAYLEVDPDVEAFSIGDVTENFDFSVARHSSGSTRVIIVDQKKREAGSSDVISIPRSEVLTKSALAVKLMKPLAFTAAIAQKDCLTTSNAVRAFTASQKTGELHNVLDALPHFDQSEVCGVFIRHFINGFIHVDLADRPFGYHTPWMCRSTLTRS